MDPKLPNFILIGAQKCGTTSVAQFLGQHPEIFISPTKEPGFFAFEEQFPDFKGPGDMPLYEHLPADLDSYRELYAEAGNATIRGEATTWYLYDPKACERIRHHLPDCKLAAILRNPADRAFSAFMHARRDAREPHEDFRTALEAEPQRVRENWEYLWHYRSFGYYHEQLSRYYKCFPKENIKVWLFDDLQADRSRFMREIFEFLGVDPSFEPDTGERANESGIPKSRVMHYLLNNRHPLKEPLKMLVPEKLRKQLIRKLKRKNLAKQAFDPELRTELLRDYEPDIRRLEKLISRDLSHWLAPSGR